MKTKVFLSIVLLILTVSVSLSQEKEKRFGVEISSGASLATNKLEGEKLNPGLGFEMVLQYRFMPFTSIYGGWGWNHFNADKSFAGNNIDFEETGYVMGLQFKHPINNSPVSYFLRAGALYCHIETENSDGDIINDTGHGWGWQAAGGIEVSIGKNWSLAPGIKFNSLSRETEFNNKNYQLDHRYVSARLGIIKRF